LPNWFHTSVILRKILISQGVSDPQGASPSLSSVCGVMVKCFAQLVILSSVFSLLIVPQVPAAAEVGNEASSEEEASIGGHGSLEQLETPRTNDPEPMTRNSVLDLNEMERPNGNSTSANYWGAN
jgi:hypothetical protein